MRPHLTRHLLVDVVTEALRAQRAAATDDALRGLARGIAARLMAAHAGARVPKPQPERDARDLAIKEALRSRTIRKVAAEFRLSPSAVDKIGKYP